MSVSFHRKLLIVLFRPFSRPKARLTALRLCCCVLSVAVVFVLLTKRSNEKHRRHVDDLDVDADSADINVISHPASGSRTQLRYRRCISLRAQLVISHFPLL